VVTWLDDDALRARSSGVCEKPESYNYRTFLPEKRGLYAEEIFGPVGWSTGQMRMAEDVRDGRWGRIELPEPFAWIGAPRRSVVLVVPPIHRRFRPSSPEESRERARKRRELLLELDRSGDWPYCDPLPKLLAEEGLEDPNTIERLGTTAVEPPLNVLYRRVVNLSNRLRRYHELDAPEPVKDDDRRTIASVLDELDRALSIDVPADVLRIARGQG
jgi:hypothetical protein